MKDPVCGMDVDQDNAKTVDHNGQTYRFCSDTCAQKFQQSPDRYMQSQGGQGGSSMQGGQRQQQGSRSGQQGGQQQQGGQRSGMQGGQQGGQQQQGQQQQGQQGNRQQNRPDQGGGSRAVGS